MWKLASGLDRLAMIRAISIVLAAFVVAILASGPWQMAWALEGGAAELPVGGGDGPRPTFVPNLGQSIPDVRFQLHHPRGVIYFTEDGATLASPSGNLRARYLDTHPGLTVAGRDRSQGVSHYFQGSQPERWITGVPNFQSLHYQGLYPGVDLTYVAGSGIGTAGLVKGTFEIAPGADPRAIRWRYPGAQTSLQPGGNLQIEVATARTPAVFLERAPTAWQVSGKRRVPVAVDFRQYPDGSFGFAVGAYDQGQTLVIDPLLEFSTPLGGTAFDEGLGVAVSSTRNAYLLGSTFSTDFPGALAARPEMVDTRNVFVVKLSRDGSDLEYSAYLGGSGDDIGRAIAVDATGEIYLTGSTTSEDFPATTLAQKPAESEIDIFVVKLSVSGSAIRYGRVIGGSADDIATGIAVDNVGNAYVAGETTSPDFPVGNSVQLAYSGEENDAFLFKLNSSGTTTLYSTYLGGTLNDQATGIKVGRDGSAYVTGVTGSQDFPVQEGYLEELTGIEDSFLARLTPDGGGLIFSTYLGVGLQSKGNALDLDRDGSAYVVGTVEYFPGIPGAGDQPGVGQSSQAYVLKMDPAGQEQGFLTLLGGTGEEQGLGLAVDREGNIFVTGMTDSPDLPVDGSLQPVYGGNGDAFLAQLDPAGSVVTYNYIGGSAFDAGQGLAVDGQGNAVVVGSTFSPDFPAANPLQSSFGGEGDAFVLRIGEVEFVPPPPPEPTPPPPQPTPAPTAIPTLVDQLVQSDQFLFGVLGVIGLLAVLMLFEAVRSRRR